jgi:hypothetical protein
MKNQLSVFVIICSAFVLPQNPATGTDTTHYCPGGQYYSPPPQGKRTDYITEQLGYIDGIELAIKRMNKKAADSFACLQAQFPLIQNMSKSITNRDYLLYSSTIVQFDMTCTVDNYLEDYMEYWLIFEEQVKENRDGHYLTASEIARLEKIADDSSHNAQGSAVIKLRLAKEWEKRFPNSVNMTAAKSVNLYPNPTSGKLILEWNQDEMPVNIWIFNTMGKEVLKPRLNDNVLDISSLPSGMYLIMIETSRETYVQKFRVEK